MGDISSNELLIFGIVYILIVIIFSPIWIALAIPALLLIFLRKILLRSSKGLGFTVIPFVHLTTVTAACTILPWFSGYLTSALALVTLLDNVSGVTYTAVQVLWHRTLMQVALFTSGKAFLTKLTQGNYTLGWTFRMVRLFWWNEKAIYVTEGRLRDMRSVTLRALLILSMPVLAMFEVLMQLSKIGATGLWTSLLPVSAATLDNGRTVEWAAALFTSFGVFVYLMTVVLVTVILPSLDGKIIRTCRRRKTGGIVTENEVLKDENIDEDESISEKEGEQEQDDEYKQERENESKDVEVHKVDDSDAVITEVEGQVEDDGDSEIDEITVHPNVLKQVDSTGQEKQVEEGVIIEPKSWWRHESANADVNDSNYQNKTEKESSSAEKVYFKRDPVLFDSFSALFPSFSRPPTAAVSIPSPHQRASSHAISDAGTARVA